MALPWVHAVREFTRCGRANEQDATHSLRMRTKIFLELRHNDLTMSPGRAHDRRVGQSDSEA